MDAAINALQGAAAYRVEKIENGARVRQTVVAKLLVGNSFARHNGSPRELDQRFVISLREVESFLCKRIRTTAEKLQDWNFFPSELFQLLVWQQEQRRRERPAVDAQAPVPPQVNPRGG